MAAKRKSLGLIVAATVFVAFGSWLLFNAHFAHTHDVVIPGGGEKAPWMNPWQAYIAAGLCFAAAVYALISAFIANASKKG